jgi:hypothetical protein
MCETPKAQATVAVSAGLSALAGLLRGPAIVIVPLAVMIWLDPITGIWLTVTAAAATAGYILGILRKPHPLLYRKTIRDDGTWQIARLEHRLAEATTREHALLAALAAAHHPGSYAAVPVPAIRGRVPG